MNEGRVAALRRALAAGDTLTAAGRKLGMSKSQAHRLAELHDLPRARRWRRSPEALAADDVALLLRLARICQCLARGQTVTETGSSTGLSKSVVHRLLVYHRLPHRRRGMDPQVRAELERRLAAAEDRPAELARQLGISKSTVSAEERKELDAVGSFRPKQLKQPRRCDDPECGRLVTYWPCPVCAARKERERLEREGKT